MLNRREVILGAPGLLLPQSQLDPPPLYDEIMMAAYYYGWYESVDSGKWEQSRNGHFVPAQGRYASTDIRVIEGHFSRATSAGIRCFLYNHHGVESFVDRVFTGPFGTVARQFAPSEMTVAINIDLAIGFGVDRTHTIPMKAFRRYIQHVIRTHMQHPNYLRINKWNGTSMEERPLIVLYIGRAVRDDTFGQAIEFANEECERVFGVRLYVVSDEAFWSRTTAGRSNLRPHLRIPDAFTGFNAANFIEAMRSRDVVHIHQRFASSYAKLGIAAKELGLRKEVVIVPGCVPNFHKVGTGVRVFPEMSGGRADYYKGTIGALEAVLPQATVVDDLTGAVYIFIYGWNEYLEMAVLEPTKIGRDPMGIDFPGDEILAGVSEFLRKHQWPQSDPRRRAR